MRAFGSMPTDFLYLLTVFELKGVKVVGGGAIQLGILWKNFIFDPISMGFFPNDSL